MRIACLQFDPKLGEPAANRARADAMLAAEAPGGLDVLLLPEMAFSGYCFSGPDEIAPFCEPARTGPTAMWASRTAQRLGACVLCGFPEQGDDGRRYNALVATDRTGAVVAVYRKHFLYTTDESWASPGDAFTTFDVPTVGRVAPAICMDLNPERFEAPFERREFASALFDPPLALGERATRRHRLRARWIFGCMNWLRAEADRDVDDAEHAAWLMNYWAGRLAPVLGRPAVLAVANRVGDERTARFAGASCVIDLGRRTVLGALGSAEESLLVVDVA